MVSTTQLAQQLKGLTFPCRKADCVAFAREHGASAEAVAMLEQMPERRFDSMADVWSALGEVA
ncbi:MAG: DUF2795 domain-containing protein [Chloroflexi bacterium]|nr:DUF2795 domain-containing protein [Chloroflexota bacterium]MCL5107667.1 DUF2795 domain-containing protein [Chloroflexota bacterium]